MSISPYFTCVGCGLGGYPSDDALGIDGLLGPQARRMAYLASTTVSFARAEHLPGEPCGWSVSDETLRQTCYREAKRVGDWRGQPHAAEETFGKAEGEVELQIDAAEANTDTGWRDMKIGIFAKRPPGEPCAPAEQHDRVLPEPTARVAFCAIETSEEFGRRCGRRAVTLALTVPALLGVLGDGAAWIWDIVKEHFAGAEELLDLWHGLEHVGKASEALYGRGSAEGLAWQKCVRGALLADGWLGLCEQVGKAMDPCMDPAKREALDALVSYYAKNLGRVNYCARLYKGQSVGSGMVEGAAKNVIGKRPKANVARWRVANVQQWASRAAWPTATPGTHTGPLANDNCRNLLAHPAIEWPKKGEKEGTTAVELFGIVRGPGRPGRDRGRLHRQRTGGQARPAPHAHQQLKEDLARGGRDLLRRGR